MIRILIGDVRERLAELPDESVHCVVTSPPYWGLRDYGTATWEGGDQACDHFKLAGGTAAQALGKSAAASAANVERSSVAYRELCGKCGARRIDAQIGLEPTPVEYVETMVAVFREVRRALRGDGTLWLNLGDSYVANPHGSSKYAPTAVGLGHSDELQQRRMGAMRAGDGKNSRHCGLKPKDLVGIPWRVAFALQADGWWLRQDIIWSKPNPMPESVTDRCTKAHEYLFLLSKSERYHYDQDAIRQEPTGRTDRITSFGAVPDRNDGNGGGFSLDALKGANKRSVWEIATQPFSEAHFATFPPALIEPCILAGCPKGGTVLDPFGGAGTTGLVADRLGRDAILVELNPKYAAMAERRVRADAPMFADVALAREGASA